MNNNEKPKYALENQAQVDEIMQTRKRFYDHADKYDNIRCKSQYDTIIVGHSFIVILNQTGTISFRIKLEDNFEYRILSTAKSKIKVPDDMLPLKFTTPEEALDTLVKYLHTLNYKIYKSNAVDFIMSIQDE